MDPDLIDELVTESGRLVARNYVFPELAERLRRLLAERHVSGHYRRADGPASLAELVTADLQSLNGDPHLRLQHHEDQIPDLPDDSGLIEVMAREARERCGGVARVERLDGGTALLELRPLLYPMSMAAAQLTAALRLVAEADALVIDLRRNRGGDPATVAFVCSHLFDEPTHLHTMYFGDGGAPRQSWTHAVAGPVFGGQKPLAVLTASDTFSGAEELAYDLQQHRRATVVGERTRGGAHPREGFRLHPHLELAVPTGRPVHPVTDTNWEGTGVLPDLPSGAEGALAAALAHLSR